MVTDYWRIVNISFFIFSSFTTWRLRNAHQLVDNCYHQNCRIMYFTDITEDVFTLNDYIYLHLSCCIKYTIIM
jgi:hypothetical protein